MVGCSKKYTLKILENRYLIYQNDSIVHLNTLKNPGEIDLDNSNIKNYPINLISEYKIYDGSFGDDDKIQLKIDEFLEQQKYENNIYDEIDKYNSLNQKNYKNIKKNSLDIYMKYNEYFYTYFYSNFVLKNKTRSDSIYKKERIDRTDFIYSNDFERLFIGQVNINKYNKTLLINLNEINKFELYEEKNDYGDYSYNYGFLKIMYKNEKKEEIRICCNATYSLEKFILLLN